MITDILVLNSKIRKRLIIFILGMLLSGLTAFPIESELRLADRWINDWQLLNPVGDWIKLAYAGVRETNANYPFIAYGTDWLAFAHIVLALAFIGPFRQPVKNVWVVEFGIIACAAVVPLAVIAGEIRGIPGFWRLIDSMFGVVGALVLIPCYKNIKRLEALKKT